MDEGKKEIAMKPMRYFVDTHDHRSGTFPAGISRPDFAAFFAQYEKEARGQDVLVLNAHVGFSEGRAFCFNAAADADAVRRAHEKAGLPFETITEVSTTTPGDLAFDRRL
jgi:hypothetical protein